jgi:streptomycin 6-kinase
LCEHWHLSRDDERIGGGAWGVVVYCRTENGCEAVLKVCANEARLSAETSAMLAWSGGPAVGVLAHRAGALLLLLQRACPGTPSRLAHSPAGDAARRASPTRARDRARPRRLAGEHQRLRLASVLPAGNRTRPAQRRNGRPLHTRHGDLQAANILAHRGASAVIDPVGIAGPREPDVANAALYNNWGEEPSARIRRLADLTGTDPAFALRFGQLSAVYAALATRS